MTAWFYGQAPNKEGNEVPFVGGRNGRFLAELAHVDESVLSDLFTFKNILDYWPGPRKGGGDAFPMEEARERARVLKEEWSWGDTVLVAGWNAAAAFEIVPKSFLKWVDVEGVQYAVFPHPSSLNRYWNSGHNRARASRFLVAAIREVLLLRPEYEVGF